MELEQRRNEQGQVSEVVVQLSGERLSMRLDTVRRARHSDRRRRARDRFIATGDVAANNANSTVGFDNNQLPHRSAAGPLQGQDHCRNDPDTTCTVTSATMVVNHVQPQFNAHSQPLSVNLRSEQVVSSSDFSDVELERGVVWADDLLDLVAAHRGPGTTAERDPQQPQQDGSSSVESASASSDTVQTRNYVDVGSQTSSSSGQSGNSEQEQESSSSSSSRPPRMLNVSETVSSLTALLMANQTLPPDQVARVIARWHSVSSSQLFVVEAMTLAAMAMGNALCDRLLRIMHVASGANDPAAVALASICTELALHRQRDLNVDFNNLFPDLQALDYPIELD